MDSNKGWLSEYGVVHPTPYPSPDHLAILPEEQGDGDAWVDLTIWRYSPLEDGDRIKGSYDCRSIPSPQASPPHH